MMLTGICPFTGFFGVVKRQGMKNAKWFIVQTVRSGPTLY